jgi:NitT/TauT family transport system substrate-binding protein
MTLPSLKGSSAALRIAFIAIFWLALISFLHAFLNTEKETGNKVLMGYMPVITNLAAPLVDFASKKSAPQFEALKFGSFAEMGEAFRSGHLQVAFIIAPLAIAMYQQGVPLKVVYIGNRHESTLVVRNEIPGDSLLDMTGKTIAVPMRFSGHLLALKKFQREHGMDAQAIRTVEIAPPDMPAALAAGGIDGYFVGEPFASKALQTGIGRRLLNVESIWPKFICNLMIVREDLIRTRPQWVQQLVSASVRSGYWAQNHVGEAAQQAASYWGQDPKVIQHALSNPPGRTRFDLYVPKLDELQEMAHEMQKNGLIDGPLDIQGMVEDRFAIAVDVLTVDALQDIYGDR